MGKEKKGEEEGRERETEKGERERCDLLILNLIFFQIFSPLYFLL